MSPVGVALNMTRLDRPRITGVEFVDDAFVQLIGMGGQLAIAAIILPVAVIVTIGALIAGVLLWGAIAFLLGLAGVSSDAISGLVFIPLVVSLGVGTWITVKFYRRLPTKLRRVAFELYDDPIDEQSATPRPDQALPKPSLAELDARLAPRENDAAR
jgi:hypothetical protein